MRITSDRRAPSTLHLLAGIAIAASAATQVVSGTTFDAGAEITHAVNGGNALTSVTTTDLSSNSVTQSYLYDGSGNLIFDGQLFYQYDAFNRLMQVNLAGDLTVNDFNMNAPAGRLKPGVADDAGQKLAAFVYDGFGRLIRTQRWDPLGNSELESYYYDGVRRVQERVDDDPNDPNSAIATREYVWGPGYVDEIVCQVDEQGDLLYYLQDANYNVVAVTDEDGAVVAQYAYEPYGGVVVADTFTTTAYPDPNAPPINRIGHQGLFFERLYVDADDPNDPNDTYDTLSDPALSPPTDPNLATPLPGLYQVRNRVLIPNLGRFAQRDMNETALPIITALAMNGDALDGDVAGFSAWTHFGDGLNLYSYCGLNPIDCVDGLGLSFDDLTAWYGQMAEEDVNVLTLGFVRAVRGLQVLIEERDDDIAYLSDTVFTDEFDVALETYQQNQLERNRLLSQGIKRFGFRAMLKAMGLPTDFHFFPKSYIVYIGYDDAGQAKYVGIAKNEQRYKARKSEHKKYDLKKHVVGRSKREAKSIETLIIEKNRGNFDNKIRSVSPRHKWFDSAIAWAKNFCKTQRIRIRF